MIPHLNNGEVSKGIRNHLTASLSELEMRMVLAIPEGGNWRDIPDDIESERVKRIKRTGGRTTYYGRLKWHRPAYTINTYFSRTGNGCFIHPVQHRLISLREGARLQSFLDNFVFYGTKTSMYYQIGNAVPPLFGRALGEAVRVNKFVDLFCGAGGFSCGMEMCGGTCELAIDHDKHCIETFRRNHNIDDDKVYVKDIREFNLNDLFSPLPKIDLVIGGPPCQGFSTAGNCILDDPRNELVKYFIRSVAALQPDVFIMENVKGLIYFKKGQVLREIHDAFADIGYNAQYRVLNAAHFGVPQLRERVIIIGRRDGQPILFPRPLFADSGGKLPPFTTVWDAISDLPSLEVGGGIMELMPYKDDPLSDYQRLMRGEFTFKAFYSSQLEKYNAVPAEKKMEGTLTLSQFS